MYVGLFFLNIEEYVLIGNMKQARPWMLANLKIFCRLNAHPVHQHSFGPRYIGDAILGSKLVSFNQILVPYEISKVNFQCAEKQIIVCMSEEI